jgi:ABC-2 type transport system ATP-binding protein
MKVAEQLVYLARLHGLSRRDAETNAAELLERLGLAERGNDTVESLSLGNQQRAQIAAALVHSPEVLILDEPFSGLDPMAVETVLGVLHDVAKRGAPVLFSSHQLNVVERLCDDIVVIADGRIRASGSRQKLQDDNALRQFELLVASDAAWVREMPGVTVLDFDGGYALFEADDDEAAQAVLRRALLQGPVASFAPRHRSLTEIFREVVK